MSKYAFVLTLFMGDSYLPGVLVIAYSIFKTKTKYDVVCMVTPDVSENAVAKMLRLGIIPIRIDYIKCNSYLEERPRMKKRYPNIELYCTKFNCLNLVQYKKVFLLDVDMCVQHNIDHIFELNTPAVRAALHSSVSFGVYSILYLNDGAIIPKNLANTFLHDEGGSIDAGCMLFEPNIQIFEEYKLYLETFDPRNYKTVMGDDDTSIFSFYLKKNIMWRYLNLKWSCIYWKMNGLCTLKDSLIINYIGLDKPWEKDLSKYEDLQPWYALNNEIKTLIQ
jgi:alpha-N-acetylglucosamine transferase